jgi:hypothetical protein
MDLSTADIFAGLATMAFVASAGAVVYARSRPPLTPVPVTRPEDTGRHHVPRGLLDDPTTKLKPNPRR